jgi:autotransporter-associated beta strand protein
VELHHSPPQPKRLSYFLTASYKGGTTVGAGTLVANAYGALGTGNVTVSGGTLTESASFALTGGQALIVSGGAASLSKANNYGGGTTVSSGTLVAANTSGSATGSGPVTVGSSGTLGGSGFLSGAVTVLSGGQLAPSAGVSGGTTTLTLGGGLTLAAGSSLDFNFGLVGGSPASDLAVVNGALSLPSSGTVALNVNAPGGLGAGSYDFLNYSGNLTQGGTGSFSLPTSSTYSYTIDIATKNGMNELLLNVAVAAGPVTWAGGGAGTWTGTGVWQNGATYADGYPVTFDNSATGTTSVMLNSTVRPSSVTFSNTSGGSGGKAYTISGNGTLADAPGGTGTTLTVSGGGTVTLGILTGGYTYSGQTTVSNNSTLILDGSTIQSSNVTVTGANLGVTTRGGTIGQTLSVGGTSDLLDGGSLSVTGQTTVTDGTFIIGNGTGNVTLNANGGLAVSGGSIAANNAASNDTINIGSGRLLSYTSSTGSLFQGVLGGNGGLLLNSTPIDGVAATLELANGNSYGGGTTVQSGLLQLDRGDALPAGTPGSDGTPAGEMLLISEIGGNGSAPTPGVVLNSFLMSAGEMGYGGSSGGPVAAPADISAVPEPATPLLLAAAAVLALLAAWRRLAAAAAAQ